MPQLDAAGTRLYVAMLGGGTNGATAVGFELVGSATAIGWNNYVTTAQGVHRSSTAGR